MRLHLSHAVALTLLTGCAVDGAATGFDLRGSAGKADGTVECQPVEVAEGDMVEVHVDGDAFRAQLRQDGYTITRLVAVDAAGLELESAPSIAPVVEARADQEQTWALRVDNENGRGGVTAELCVEKLGARPEYSGPVFQVRFTEPQCAADEEHGVPAGVRCNSSHSEKERSRARAGATDQMVQWIAETRRVKELHPERDVSITMAYLTWNDDRIYDSICRAARAGVRVVGFFDRGNGGRQPSRLAYDGDCAPENVSLHYLGGLTSYPTWRLMHIKMMLLDTGDATSRLIFGSANLSSYAGSIHFENWGFAELESDSRFIETHRCAAEGLLAAEGHSYPADAPAFREAFEACTAAIEADPDPRFRVYFTPDEEEEAVHAAIDAMRGASSSVEMMIQHFNHRALANGLAEVAGNDALRARLLLDDDTFYNEGEGGGTDHSTYQYTLRGSGLDIRFLQTNGHLEYGKQFQHNKYIVIDDSRVFCGAGNFTDVGFKDNYESFYLFDLPELAEQYAAHFARVFDLGKAAESLPEDGTF
jgi:hypothetical protein